MLTHALRAVVISLITGLLVVAPTASPAAAADSCGSGYHKQSDGELSGRAANSKAGRKVIARISGYVRYCTRERAGRPDQLNQRILVGIPRAVVSLGRWEGGFSKKCMTQVTTVTLGRVQKDSTISMSGKMPGASVTYGDNWVKLKRRNCVPKNEVSAVKRMIFSSNTLTVTAPKGRCIVSSPGTAAWYQCTHGPYIKSIEVVTKVNGSFTKGGTNYNPQAVQRELDLSS
jgi:hypothetical protein